MFEIELSLWKLKFANLKTSECALKLAKSKNCAPAKVAKRNAGIFWVDMGHSSKQVMAMCCVA